MSSAFGGSRGLAPKAPEKGVFPLDHFGECKEVMSLYLKCLKENNNRSEPCQEFSKKYLECRMSRNLMAPQDLQELGFKDDRTGKTGPKAGDAGEQQPTDQEQGYVAGLKRFKKH